MLAAKTGRKKVARVRMLLEDRLKEVDRGDRVVAPKNRYIEGIQD
jgi:hypothetical protein